jgi:hypothetical protein
MRIIALVERNVCELAHTSFCFSNLLQMLDRSPLMRSTSNSQHIEFAD